jgi:hypothetical protein
MCKCDIPKGSGESRAVGEDWERETAMDPVLKTPIRQARIVLSHTTETGAVQNTTLCRPGPAACSDAGSGERREERWKVRVLDDYGEEREKAGRRRVELGDGI